MKNNTNLKKLGALLLTGAMMTGAIVGTNAITAKAAGSGAANTFLLDVPAEIAVYTSTEEAEDVPYIGIYTTSSMPEGKQITLSATTTNDFKLVKTDQTGDGIPYQLIGSEWMGGNTAYFNDTSLSIDGNKLQASEDENAEINGFSYAYLEGILVGALADQDNIDSAGEGDYEDEITFIAKMENKTADEQQ